MDEEQENVKKIRELDSFETSQPLATGDYLIVATNEGIPATKKSTIKEVVDVYNIAMAEDDEEDQVDDPNSPGEKIKDPEKEPGLEKDKDGDGEPDEKIITTPVNAGNLDTIIEILKQTNLYEDGIEEYLLSKKDNENLLNEARQANAIGISGVPCFIFNKEFVINGAQPSDVFKNIINSLKKND